MNAAVDSALHLKESLYGVFVLAVGAGVAALTLLARAWIVRNLRDEERLAIKIDQERRRSHRKEPDDDVSGVVASTQNIDS